MPRRHRLPNERGTCEERTHAETRTQGSVDDGEPKGPYTMRSLFTWAADGNRQRGGRQRW